LFRNWLQNLSKLKMLRRGAFQIGRRVQRPVSATLTAAQNQVVFQSAPAAVSVVAREWFSSYPPHEVVGLPALSPTMETGTIASWNMDEGDSFGPGDIICSVETDKATVDFEAQDDGFIAKILVEASSDELEVGAPIMITVEEEEDTSSFKDYVIDSAPVVTPPVSAVDDYPAPSPTSQAPAVPDAGPTLEASLVAGEKLVASPLAHMISKEMGYELSTIPGTGPDGRIIAADVREYFPAATTIEKVTPVLAEEAIATAIPISGAGYIDYPIPEYKKEVANRLAQSKRNVPHYYLTVDICMDATLKLRNELAAAVDEEEGLGLYELIIKAAAKSMKAVPSVNASWIDSAVRIYDAVDMNVVVGTGDKMYTPVIRDCGTKGLKAISDELNSAVSAVESGELTSEFTSVGTFTIMNLGMYGIKSCAPIIREPQSSSLALGALENRIVPNDDPNSDEFYKESVVMTATISLDHRVVDGAAGAPWLSAFKSYLESPTTLLL